MARFYLVHGQTSGVDVQLLLDGAPLNLTGIAASSIVLVLRGLDGILVDTANDVEIVDAASGKIRYNPDFDDLNYLQSPYTGRWKVTDTAGKILFVPNRDFDQWFVGRGTV